MALLKQYLLEAVDTMERDHIRLHFFGDMTPIAPELRALARETDEITEHLSPGRLPGQRVPELRRPG